MNVTVRMVVKSDRFEEIIARYPGAIEDIIAKTTADCLDAAQAIVPVDTGALKNSIAAEVDGFTGVVSTNMEYAWFVEDGTYKMAAQPFMRPAALTVEGQFVEALTRLHEAL